jgi:hypothetical protein
MSDDPNKRLSDAEESALRALSGDLAPSPGLEDRVVADLKRRGYIRANGGWIMKSTKAVVAAVVLGLVFVAGFAVGSRKAATAPVMTEHPGAGTTEAAAAGQYMLLMYTRAAQHKEERALPEADYRAIVAEYRDWAMAREGEGRLVSAEKLSDQTRVMTIAADGVAIAASSESDRILGGYFLVTARDLDDALELAKTHPHLKYGGEVEVRPIESTR